MEATNELHNRPENIVSNAVAAAAAEQLKHLMHCTRMLLDLTIIFFLSFSRSNALSFARAVQKR